METENIYVAPPPVLNITTVIVQAETVSRNAKIDLNFPRFNLCISFLVDFIKFFDNITPTLDSDNNTIKLINFGYFDVIEKLKVFVYFFIFFGPHSGHFAGEANVLLKN